MTHVIVVGGGLGGLSTAARLAGAGLCVTVLEKNDTLGGRCNVLCREGFTFDTGPTLLLMKDAVEELFRSLGRDMDDYAETVRIDPNYRIVFGDGAVLTMCPKQADMEEELERFSPGSVPGFRAYVADAGFKYRVARKRFVERNFLRFKDFATAANLRYLFKTNTLRKLDAHAARYFKDGRLRSAFTFQTMYLGLPPASAPSVYSLLVYTELAEGIWFPKGGMYSMVQGLERLCLELGVCIRRKSAVTRIVARNGRVVGVEVDGHVEGCDAVVSNADLPYTYATLLPRAAQSRLMTARLPRFNPGSSAYLLFIGSSRAYSSATHHTVYLAADVDANYESVFSLGRLPEDPSLYVCDASRTEPSLSPHGRDGLYVLVPVPSNGHVDWPAEEPAFRERVLARVTALGFGDTRQYQFVESTTPDNLRDLYNLANGSAFGLAHNFLQVGYMRPSNKAAGIKGMYFCGASTVPGGGVPMVVIGSRLTAERVLHDLGR